MTSEPPSSRGAFQLRRQRSADTSLTSTDCGHVGTSVTQRQLHHCTTHAEQEQPESANSAKAVAMVKSDGSVLLVFPRRTVSGPHRIRKQAPIHPLICGDRPLAEVTRSDARILADHAIMITTTYQLVFVPTSAKSNSYP